MVHCRLTVAKLELEVELGWVEGAIKGKESRRSRET